MEQLDCQSAEMKMKDLDRSERIIAVRKRGQRPKADIEKSVATERSDPMIWLSSTPRPGKPSHCTQALVSIFPSSSYPSFRLASDPDGMDCGGFLGGTDSLALEPISV
jgi:hypothetical protein